MDNWTIGHLAGSVDGMRGQHNWVDKWTIGQLDNKCNWWDWMIGIIGRDSCADKWGIGYLGDWWLG